MPALALNAEGFRPTPYYYSTASGYAEEPYFYGVDGVEINYSKAFTWFNKIESNIQAQSYLGLMCLHGLGCDKDEKKGVTMLKAASSKGASLAQAFLGQYYFDGKRYKEAFAYLTPAADKRRVEAFYPLALMYEDGLGVAVDHDKAYNYFKLAAFNNTNKNAYPFAAEKALERKDYTFAMQFAKRCLDVKIDVDTATAIIKKVNASR